MNANFVSYVLHDYSCLRSFSYSLWKLCCHSVKRRRLWPLPTFWPSGWHFPLSAVSNCRTEACQKGRLYSDWWRRDHLPDNATHCGKHYMADLFSIWCLFFQELLPDKGYLDHRQARPKRGVIEEINVPFTTSLSSWSVGSHLFNLYSSVRVMTGCWLIHQLAGG